MKDKPSYLAAAFNARPLGMPIPPNWFGLAAFGLLGALDQSRACGSSALGARRALPVVRCRSNERFRATVDADAGVTDSTSRYENLLAHLDSARAVAASTKSSARPRRSSACCSEARRTARRSATCARWPGCT